MKVILVDRKPDGSLAASLGVDSAVLRHGEPVFVPEPVDAWRSRIMPALRISRLGMHISAKNAPRHYDSLSLFHVVTPVQPLPGIPDGLIDRTFSPGEWLSVPDDGRECAFVITRGAIGGRPDFSASGVFSPASLGADTALAWLSEACTLRTGDVLLFADAAVDTGFAVADTCVRADVDEENVLNIRIK